MSTGSSQSRRLALPVDEMRDGIREDSGITLRTAGTSDQPRIELRTDPSVHGEEAYRLTVTPQRIEIAAADDRGLFWGAQTLRQLLPPGRHATLAIPAVRIDDGAGALKLFKSNAVAGLIVFAALVAGLWKPGVSF